MRRPGQPALTDAATGRVSMPFLPTLAVVALLGAASLYCPSPNPAAPPPRATVAALDPLTTQALATQAAVPAVPVPSATDFARNAPVGPASHRMPAAVAFAEAYPFDGVGPVAVAIAAVRPARRVPLNRLATNRAPCPGHRCPEGPSRPGDPFAAARADAAAPGDTDALPHPALPFVDTVAETLAPATRIIGDAADLVRGSATALTGSVSLAVADCLR